MHCTCSTRRLLFMRSKACSYTQGRSDPWSATCRKWWRIRRRAFPMLLSKCSINGLQSTSTSLWTRRRILSNGRRSHSLIILAWQNYWWPIQTSWKSSRTTKLSWKRTLPFRNSFLVHALPTMYSRCLIVMSSNTDGEHWWTFSLEKQTLNSWIEQSKKS